MTAFGKDYITAGECLSININIDNYPLRLIRMEKLGKFPEGTPPFTLSKDVSMTYFFYCIEAA